MSTRRVRPTEPPSGCVAVRAQGSWWQLYVPPPSSGGARIDMVYERITDGGTVELGVAMGGVFPEPGIVPDGAHRLAAVMVYPSADACRDENIFTPDTFDRFVA